MTAALMAVAVSCGRYAKIDGTVLSAPSSEIVVKLLDVNRYDVLDTVRTDEAGRFACKVRVEKGQPEFIYLFRDGKKIASLLLESGEKVSVEADTLGRWTVTGSVGSEKLLQVETDHAAAQAQMAALAEKLAEAVSNRTEADRLRKELGQEYISYYRDRVRYVMANSHSLTVVPVFYQYLGENLPVFGQSTDAIHFSNACDSLEMVYPDSRYVKALRAEAKRRFGYLEMESRLKTAEEIGFPDVELPDMRANMVKLSDVDAKIVMVHFWNPQEAAHKMFNLDVLAPVYKDYHDKGFEIYQVALNADKAGWARVMKQQKLPWINVCDIKGLASPVAVRYNVSSLPVSFFIGDGSLIDAKVSDEKSLRALLNRLLK